MGGMGSASGGMNSRFPGSPREIPSDPSQVSPLYDPTNPGEADKRVRMINAERQKTMVSETNKLVKLAAELNAEIARSNSGELSPAQLRKVAEIEKLAHSVRDKMVMSVRGPQFNMDNPPPYFPSTAH
jgi:DNA-binding transcriptional regulator YdaS (Cro superfamily)